MHPSADSHSPKLNRRMNTCSDCSKKSKCRGCTSKCFPVPLNKVQVKGILERFDGNGDRRLSKQELKDAFYYIGSHFPNWRAARALDRADRNRDGYISDDEMDGLVEYVWQCGYTIS